MKKPLLFVAIVFLSFITKAQKLDDFGRIVLNTYLPQTGELSASAHQLLSTKLDQIATNYGMGGSQVNPRFVITAIVNVGTKDIISGPPQMIAQNLEVSIIIGDALTKTIYSNTILNLKGVGTNETKAFMQAFKRINPRNKQIENLITEAKEEIVAYYNTQCDFIIKDAQTLVNQGKYDEAIYNLSLVPEVCQECYFKSLDSLSSIYQQKIDNDGFTKFNQAKMAWAGSQNEKGAEKTANILSTIHTQSSCQPQVKQLVNQINGKLKADEKSRWVFKMKQYDDKILKEKEQMRIAENKSIRDDEYREKQAGRNLELDKLKVNAYREVATEFAKNQPKEINYHKSLF